MPRVRPYKDVYAGRRNTVYERPAAEGDLAVIPYTWTEQQMEAQYYFRRHYAIKHDASDGPPWNHGDIDMTEPGYFMLGSAGSFRAVGGAVAGETLGQISAFFNDDYYADNAGSFLITFFETPPGGSETQVSPSWTLNPLDSAGLAVVDVRHLYTYRWTVTEVTPVYFRVADSWTTTPDGDHGNYPWADEGERQYRDSTEAELFSWSVTFRTPVIPVPPPFHKA